MTLKNRIEAFSYLGNVLREGLKDTEKNSVPDPQPVRHTYFAKIKSLIDTQVNANPWFTPENVRMSLEAIANELTEENITFWTSGYPALNNFAEKKTIGVVMAGNIPLVGFHDFLSVLITGNRIIAKTSSKDSDLLKFIAEIICDKYPEFKDDIIFTEDQIKGFDAIIATGSGNSSRYFDYYFGKYPNIIRKNRNSIAVLTGTETTHELEQLGNDIFSYFGLGCRNVSKIFIPAGYDFDIIIKSWKPYEYVVNHNKYANNYDHNKAVYLVNRVKFLDAGFVLLKEDTDISSPISVLYYEYYNDPQYVSEQIESMKERIQCIVGNSYIPFGTAQSPRLWDYADGINTIEFLLKLKNSV